MRTCVLLSLGLVILYLLGLTLARKIPCQYERPASSRWSNCDPIKHKRVLILRLKPGQPASCKKTSRREMACTPLPKDAATAKKAKGECKYGRLRWIPCDSATHIKYAVRKLKAGSPPYCHPEVGVQTPCR